jgi:hypothetical protein
MNPTHQSGERRTLSASEVARVRELLGERERIVKRLRHLDGREMAAMIPLPLIQMAAPFFTG